jgi:hypothetical protein
MALRPSGLDLGGAEAEVKFQCAYNFPAVVQILGASGYAYIV